MSYQILFSEINKIIDLSSAEPVQSVLSANFLLDFYYRYMYEGYKSPNLHSYSHEFIGPYCIYPEY